MLKGECTNVLRLGDKYVDINNKVDHNQTLNKKSVLPCSNDDVMYIYAWLADIVRMLPQIPNFDKSSLLKYSHNHTSAGLSKLT